MPFETRGTKVVKPPGGPKKTRKYAVWYISRTKDSTDPANWLVGEFRGYNLNSVHNAVVRHLRAETGRTDLVKGDVFIMEAHVLPLRTTLDAYLDALEADEEG